MARVFISESVKEEIAERLIEQAYPGYSKDAQGEWYVVNGQRVVNAGSTRQWSPWAADDAVISVEDLAFEFGGARQDHASFECENYDDKSEIEMAVIFALSYVPDSYNAE